MPLDGKTAHHGGDVCEQCVLLAKSLPSGSFCLHQIALRCLAVNVGRRIYDGGNVLKRWNTFLDKYSRNISPDFSRRADRKEALILGGNLHTFQYLCPTPPYSSIFGGRGWA
jgi:hypothetical protein